jgi:hypothetical protein
LHQVTSSHHQPPFDSHHRSADRAAQISDPAEPTVNLFAKMSHLHHRTIDRTRRAADPISPPTHSHHARADMNHETLDVSAHPARPAPAIAQAAPRVGRAGSTIA